MLETQPLSEPLEPLPDMQCEDSELSVAGEEQESHSEDHEFGHNNQQATTLPQRSHKPTGKSHSYLGHFKATGNKAF